MAKSIRKRKNYKLRRRVMRTVSALTMVMAVTVAAIPVENYGTMEASEKNPVAEKYAGFVIEKESYDPAKYEFESFTKSIELQRITNNGFEKLFKAKQDGNSNAIITGYVGSGGAVEIREKEAYDYVVFDNTYIDALGTALKDEKYSMEFQPESTKVTYEGDGAVDAATEKEVSVKKIKADSVSFGFEHLISYPKSIDIADENTLSYGNPYKSIKTADNTYAEGMLKSLGYYNSLIQEITSYNAEADRYINDLNNAKNGTAEDWKNLIKTITEHNGKVNDAANKREYSYEAISKDNKFDLAEYTILNRAQHKDKNYGLAAFELVNVYDAVSKSGVYVLHKNSASDAVINSEQTKNLDSNDYLAGGIVTVTGIKSKAFYSGSDFSGIEGNASELVAAARTITDVTINNPSLKFIGKEAFSASGASSALRSVSFERANILEIIGDSAFENCGALNTVTFNSASVVSLATIGTRAFKNTNLGSIIFPMAVTNVGADSFAQSKLTSIQFEGGSTTPITIGEYAFYNCANLENGDYFSGGRPYKIKEGAFAIDSVQYGASSRMTQFSFPEDMTSISDNNMTGEAANNDYILAGRRALETVTMPKNFAGYIPDNTFAGCEELAKLTFPTDGNSSTWDASFDPKKLFASVKNDSFYVEGPMNKGRSDNREKAKPRTCTWSAVNGNGNPVPYRYIDKDNNECWEYGINSAPGEEAPYVASVASVAGEQVLMHVVKNENAPANTFDNSQILDIGTIGNGTVITRIGNGDSVVDSDIRDKFYKLVIHNDSVVTISPNAFNGMEKLEWVEIGNSVESIGSGAFGGCSALENVVFNQIPFMLELSVDDEAWSRLSIAEDAFNTGSSYMTFHGAINPYYAPFVYAQRDNHQSFRDGANKQICYKSDAPTAVDYSSNTRTYDPSRLTVIRNNKDGKMTLIDYPHYEDVDVWNEELKKAFENDDLSGVDAALKDIFKSITGRFEQRHMIHAGGGEDEDVQMLGNSESVVSKTIEIDIPAGIESVDTVKYFVTDEKENKDNFDYLTRYYKELSNPGADGSHYDTDGKLPRNINKLADNLNDVQKLYSDASYAKNAIKDGDSDVSIPGLFSGYFKEADITARVDAAMRLDEAGSTRRGLIGGRYNGRSFAENETHNSGNDNLMSVALTDVDILPNNAFYSCESLQTVSISDKLTDFGKLPFKDCKNLHTVNTNGNTKYICNAGTLLLLEDLGDGSYKLVECFEGRGKSGSEYGNAAVSGAEMSNVSELADGSFSNCQELTSVDLRNSSITTVPYDCFSNSENLGEVRFPESISIISENSFTGLGKYIDLHIPAKNCYINVKAFDGKTTVRIHGVKYENEEEQTYSACYKAFLELDKAYEENAQEDPDTEGTFQFYDEFKTYYTVNYVDHELKVVTDMEGKPASYQVESHGDAPNYVEAPARTGFKFKEWLCRVGDDILIGSADKTVTDAWTDVTEDRTIIATYEPDPKSVAPDGNEYNFSIKGGIAIAASGTNIIRVDSNSEPIKLMGGDSVTLMADDVESFKTWTADPTDYIGLIDETSSSVTTFTMPNHDVVVTASATEIEGNNTYTVQYVDHELNLITDMNGEPASYEVRHHGNAPSYVEAPARTGYKFKEWLCRVGDRVLIGSADKTVTDAWTDVTENRTIIASYEPDPLSIVSDGNEYSLTVEGGVAIINSALVSNFPTRLSGGTTITLMANDAENFRTWTISPAVHASLIGDASVSVTSFVMPNADVTITADSAANGGSDDDTPKYRLTVNNGAGSGEYEAGATVIISANAPASEDKEFSNWTSDSAGITFTNAQAATTTITMPAADAAVTANYKDKDNSGSSDDGKTKYKLTVNYGAGSGEYAAGTSVTISAYAPESSSRVFSRWTVNNSSVGFASATSATTTLVMPAEDVTVTANYKARVDDDDDEDDDTSRRPNTNTTTTTVTSPNSNSGNTASNTGGSVTNNSNNNNNNGGSRIYITKNGVSNKDLASISVSGSTDNFIVRISESDDTAAAVEEALINRYGSLDGLVYFPMDISLYDSTGQNKITDTYGLNITITMPIPDVLIQYGGNSRVAAADNGSLQALNPVKFTTIDGIACVSFVPPHFSPYVIYVDTNNLTAGQMLDATPSTGDPIHPKWFLAIGMACVSVILFAASDGRRHKKYRTV